MRYKAVLFDMDGTLLDTLGDMHASVNHVLACHGYPCRSREEVRSFVGNGARVLMRRALPEELDEAAFEPLLEEYRAWYQTHSCVVTRPYPGIPALLRELDALGIRTAVVSNKPHATTTSLAERFFPGMAALGDGLDGLARKPAPDLVRRALEELAVPAEAAVYVGDSEVDVATAANAGLDLIGVSWGFRGREKLRAAGADTIADTAEELLALVKKSD